MINSRDRNVIHKYNVRNIIKESSSDNELCYFHVDIYGTSFWSSIYIDKKNEQYSYSKS